MIEYLYAINEWTHIKTYLMHLKDFSFARTESIMNGIMWNS